jgi:hypothetical protein
VLQLAWPTREAAVEPTAPSPGGRRCHGRRARAAAGRLAGVAAAALLASACATAARSPVAAPPRPTLPAVKFVPPCDPSATVGLTAAGVDELKRRDAAWRAHVERLEAMLKSGQP